MTHRELGQLLMKLGGMVLEVDDLSTRCLAAGAPAELRSALLSVESALVYAIRQAAQVVAVDPPPPEEE